MKTISLLIVFLLVKLICTKPVIEKVGTSHEKVFNKNYKLIFLYFKEAMADAIKYLAELDHFYSEQVRPR